MSLVDGRLAVSRLPSASDIPLSVAATRTVPRVASVIAHQLHSPEHL